MEIGPGYVGSGQLQDGTIVLVPAAYRQAILVHEARHSDCTGGLTSRDVDFIKTLTSYQETEAEFKKLECGHLHSICREFNDYYGLAACDDRPWGAYAVGAVYLESVMNAYSGRDRELLRATRADLLTRFPTDTYLEDMKRDIDPDMSSSGVR
jgi:hypothetical protein